MRLSTLLPLVLTLTFTACFGSNKAEDDDDDDWGYGSGGLGGGDGQGSDEGGGDEGGGDEGGGDEGGGDEGEDPNDAPQVEVVHPAAGEHGEEGRAFEFVISVYDSVDAPEDLVLSFESDKDGIFCQPIPDATGIARCEQALSPGDHALDFSATDSEGRTGKASQTFTVTARTAIDDDGDGFSEDQGDCDDVDASVYPGAEEICGNGRDDDCDTVIDEGCSDTGDDGPRDTGHDGPRDTGESDPPQG